MHIMNRESNIFNLDCEVVWFYNINCRLNVLIDGSWSIGDLVSKVL